MRTSRRLLAAPTAVALLWALTACGGPSTEASPEPEATTTSAAAEKTVEPEAAELTTANFLKTITDAQTAAGSYDFTMTTTTQGQAMTASGSAKVEGDTQSLAMVMELPDMGQMEIRMAGGMTYMNMGELTGNKFLQIDPNDPTNPMAAGLGEMTGELDPTQGLAGQEAALASVTKRGAPEQVGGAEAQAYDVVIDPTKLPEELRAGLDQAAAAGMEVPSTFAYTYWVDTDGLVRKMTFDLMGTQTEMTFTNWGSGAPVAAPAPEEITTENPFAG